ncbi:MAG: hypothetical protein KDC05_10335 [Bacteroidales bacterium]|nr:hypothetical protein [Bacteroidales bacterium]
MENQQTNQTHPANQVPLPNASAVLILGVLSIILCWCQGIIGLILGIAALIIANKDLALYEASPGRFTQNSYSNVKTGRTIAIIGLVLAASFIFMLIFGLLFLGLNFALLPWEMSM